MADRNTSTITTTRVTQFAKPMGTARENGPHLADVREFVAACEGLPDDTLVRIEPGVLGLGGRHTVKITATHQHSIDEESDKA